jgi:recombination protein RecA
MVKKEKDTKSEKSSVNFDFTTISSALNQLKKDMGQDVCLDTEKNVTWERVPSKSPTIGRIFGKGGTPRGAIIELYGPESGGKTLIADNIVADFQHAGYFPVYIDTEYSFSPEYARIQGVDISNDKFALLHPDTGEDAFEAAIKLVQTKQVGIVVIDSLATCLPESEENGTMKDQQMGAQARMIGKGLRKLLPVAGKNKCTIILINQIRMKIGVMFGNPETTPGGNAPKFYATIRCEIRKGEKKDVENEGDDVEGQFIKIKNIKNKSCVPYRTGQIFCSFTDGLDIYGEYVDFAVTFGVIDKKGAWYSYKEEKLGQGRDNAVTCIKGNKDLFEEIKAKVDVFLNENSTKKIQGEELANVSEKETNNDIVAQALV